MKCKSARTKIALWAGNDLDASGKRELKSHLSACEPCRGYWREMKSSMHALHEPAVVEPAVRAPGMAEHEPAFNSLWPRISSRMPRRARLPKQHRFNGWAAAASVAAACCVLVAYAVTYNPPLSHNDYAVPAIPSQFVPSGAMDFPSPGRSFDRGFGAFEEDPFSMLPDSRRAKKDEESPRRQRLSEW
jgi:hypothetical protein